MDRHASGRLNFFFFFFIFGKCDNTWSFLKAEVKEAQQELNKQKDLLKACNKDINEKTREHKDLGKELYDAELKITEFEHKVTKCNKDAKDADRTVRIQF